MRLIGQEVLYEGWGRYLQLRVQLRDGAVVERQMDDHGSAAVVLPYDTARRTVLLARMPRYGPLCLGEDPHLIEAAAGLIDPGETPEIAIRREAMEELGVRLDVLEPVGRVFTSPSTTTEVGHLFLAPYAAGDRIGPGGGLAAEHEDIEVMEMPAVDAGRLADEGRLRDMKTLALILALMRRRPALFA